MTAISDLLITAITASIEAGRAIMRLYSGDIQVELKDDRSPVTAADKAAHAVIQQALVETGLPILSEEGKEIPYATRKSWSRYWLVDPLDGTKEYIARTGEFTVNIALMENDRPVAGVIYAPVIDVLYAGDVAGHAFHLIQDASRINRNSLHRLGDFRVASQPASVTGGIRVVASRSHRTPETDRFIEELKQEFGSAALVSAGSSLKFCLVAEGKADIYPRFGRTMEWDVAAGHAILLAAGKDVRSYPDDTPFLYNKPDLGNGWFIAR